MLRDPSRLAPPRRTIRAVAVAAVLCAATVLAGCTGSSNSTDPNAFHYTSATTLGSLIPVAQRKPAEDVSGTLLTGQPVNLRQYDGHVTIVNFWGSWCGPCRVELPQINLYYQAEKSKGVRVLGINTKDFVEGNAKAFVAENRISFPSLYDPEVKVGLALGDLPISGLPWTVLLDAKGRVAAVYNKPVTPADLRAGVAPLLAER